MRKLSAPGSNPSPSTAKMSLAMPHELSDRIAKESKERGVSKAQVIRTILWSYFGAHDSDSSEDV